LSQAQLLREQLRQAGEFLEGTVGDVTPEQAHWAPPGTSNPLGATYAHILLGEDFFTSMLRGAQPLFEREWAGRTGVSEPPPGPFPPQPWHDWGRTVRVDFDGMRKYGAAVFAATDAYVASLSDQELARPVDVSALGLGGVPLSWLISNGVLGHRFSHWGEISCLKGLQGAKGLPF
jgi:DinB superfamily